MSIKKIVVTGGSGKAGRAVVKDLVAHGYEVVNVDILPSKEDIGVPFVLVDLNKFSEVLEVLKGQDAVVHLAAIPAPGIKSEEETFSNNILSTYNVFQAACDLKLKKVVWASSETILGLPFEIADPVYAPIDEKSPLLPESSYSLTKVLGEEMARQFHRRYNIPFLGLRFSNIMEPHDYEKFSEYQQDPSTRQWNMWGYIDAADAAQSCRKAVEASLDKADFYIIAAEDTCMTKANRDLLAQYFPKTRIAKSTLSPRETLLSIDKAKEELGFKPEWTWEKRLKALNL
ncbi:hypothetical protein Unana1_02309 [Umbelopsis nana]